MSAPARSQGGLEVCKRQGPFRKARGATTEAEQAGWTAALKFPGGGPSRSRPVRVALLPGRHGPTETWRPNVTRWGKGGREEKQADTR